MEPSQRACGPPGGTDAVLERLGRAEGQVRGIARMVEEGRYCIDVLQQISAAQAALDTVALALVNEHVRKCLLDAAPENREEMQAELMTTRRPARRTQMTWSAPTHRTPPPSAGRTSSTSAACTTPPRRPSSSACSARRPGVLAVEANPVAQTATVDLRPGDRPRSRTCARWVEECGYHCAGRSVPGHVCDPMRARRPPHDAARRTPASTRADARRRRTGHGGHAGMSMDAMVRDMRNRFLVALRLRDPDRRSGRRSARDVFGVDLADAVRDATTTSGSSC